MSRVVKILPFVLFDIFIVKVIELVDYFKFPVHISLNGCKNDLII